MPLSLKPKRLTLSQITKRFKTSNTIHPSTASTDDTGPRLIEDLVPLIISAGRWTRRDLLVLMRVSPAWLFPVRRLLYSRARCSTLETLLSFIQSLTKNPSLAAHVPRFNLELYSVDKGSPRISEKKLNACFEQLFSCLTHLQSLTVKGPMAVAFFQCGLVKLPNPSLLEELEVEVPSAHDSCWVAPRMLDRIWTWTLADANILTSLRSLKLSGVSLTLALPPQMRGLPPSLRELTLRNALISNPHSFATSSPLTRITIITELSEARSDQEFFNSFRALLDKYHNTLEYLSYSSSCISNPLSVSQGWECPQLPHLRSLRTNGIYFNFNSPGMILHKCPQLEEWVAYQQRPGGMVDDFTDNIHVMPPMLRRVVFSEKIFLDTEPYGPPETTSLDVSSMEKAQQAGRSRNINVIFESSPCMG